MTWTELVAETARRCGGTPERTEEILDAFLDALSAGMEKERLLLLPPDFGYFEVRRVPAAGNPERLRSVPVFRPSNQLRSRFLRDAE